jgi:hypothetical protein
LRIATERSYPYILGLGAGLASFTWAGSSILKTCQGAKTLDNVFTVSAVALGFWATAATLLLAVEEKSIVKKLKRGPHFRLLVGYVLSAITWQALLMASTLAVTAFSESITQKALLSRVITACWIAVLAAGVLTTFRAYHCLGRILKAAASEGEESG